jgi:hypothetical protein
MKAAASVVPDITSARRSPGTVEPRSRSVRASDGSQAALAREEGAEVLRVSDGRGRLLFEYRPADGRCVVHAPEGDLDFEVGGRLRLRASTIELAADQNLGVRAARAEVELDEGRLVARATTAIVKRATQTFETLETGVGRLVERAREVYREAEGLAETRAGRLRLLANKTLHLLAENALIKGREDVKVKGEKIYVG